MDLTKAFTREITDREELAKFEEAVNNASREQLVGLIIGMKRYQMAFSRYATDELGKAWGVLPTEEVG